MLVRPLLCLATDYPPLGSATLPAGQLTAVQGESSAVLYSVISGCKGERIAIWQWRVQREE